MYTKTFILTGNTKTRLADRESKADVFQYIESQVQFASIVSQEPRLDVPFS